MLSATQAIGKHGLEDLSLEDKLVHKRRRSNTTSSSSSDEDSYKDHNSKPETPATPATPRSPSVSKSSRPLKYLCDFEGCGKAFSRPVRLQEHIRSHTNERIFKCPHAPCTKDFLRDTHLKHHIKTVHTKERDYVCDWKDCDKTFTTGQRLRKHREAHEKKETFRCKDYPPCVETFRKHKTLQRHIETTHLGLGSFRCTHHDEETGQDCTANFDRLSMLRIHEAEMHGELRYWCTLCPTEDGVKVGFGTYKDLQVHVRVAHPPYCTQCGLVCSSNQEVRRHMENQHSEASLDERRTFKCTYEGCQSSFTKVANLNTHIRSKHSTDKRFKCGVNDVSNRAGLEHWDKRNHCDLSFTSKQSLENHIRRHHLLESLSKDETKKKARAPRIPKPSTASMLTGAGMQLDNSSYMSCIVSTCTFRFKRRSDVENHARIAHSMQDDEITEVILEKEALSGGKFWIGGQDEDEDGEDGQEPDDFTGLGRIAVEIGGSQPSSLQELTDVGMVSGDPLRTSGETKQEPVEDQEMIDPTLL